MYRECGLHRAGKKCGVRLSRDTRDGPSLSSRLCLGCGGVHDTPPHIHIVTTSSPIAHKVRLHSARGDSAHAYARNHKIYYSIQVFLGLERPSTHTKDTTLQYRQSNNHRYVVCVPRGLWRCLIGSASRPRLILTPDLFVPTAFPGPRASV